MAKKNDIAKVETAAIQSVEQIESLILTIRGKQVILDRDLARLYSVETRVLNQAVQRNIERFPEDFMFRLTKEEFENWKSQFVISNYDEENMSSQFVTIENEDEILKSQNVISSWGGIRKLPYAFTENGIAMLKRLFLPVTHPNRAIIRLLMSSSRPVLSTHGDEVSRRSVTVLRLTESLCPK